MATITDLVPPGVVTGDNLTTLLEHARANGYAIPAVNCTSSSTANAVLEAGRKSKSPVIIQVSNGGGSFMAGKGYKDADSATVGSVALAVHVRSVAKYYGIPVILHSDHCAKKLLPWFDGMLAADEDFFAKYGEPLFGSHMLDLSEEPDEENIAICVEYFKRMVPMKIWLEMEIGITGGEEDGVNNEDVDPDKLYTTPEQVYSVYQALSQVGDMFSIAAAFGNVHGVYKPGNVKLSPERLVKHQEYTKKMIDSSLTHPLFLVMHGGSGSTDEEIQTAVKAGVVKMNIDTDTQWSYWDGLRGFEKEKRDYLQGQIGNPTGADKPNKKFYDPRVWVRKAEEAMVVRVMTSCEKLNSAGTYEPSNEPGSPQLGQPLKTPSPVVLMAAGALAGSAATLLLKTLGK
ncbi:cytosolic class II aldolase [Phaeodactylum tricornutum CCAP 1055/1]|jgi:fructose-bisphosphate aldolase class II|uniref:fructose-bisphosphate aldolase n=2 Tax=Phaeodactylum tricornutum TaxID=2850 RepID=B7G4R3_PHATC|nr:cytosolic class II aldolase [Phaeodactylum tricornutum CCAP 1055/1]EEC46498.1 cytosolic class II aldolase [Phaeodactylum tricornutum CCAP 1055/1]|mmetsp:Transcript_3459/g.8562  ORF Transcript_3459/g.8562 Transcript_3459/m.8562 type:complete len:401 (-) Transcript_3459:81-1283(-)|eukprot:XP_002181958.1 cytosolic class II aldolase [Phaeodactylum tricornutum CCAP 1055/1]